MSRRKKAITRSTQGTASHPGEWVLAAKFLEMEPPWRGGARSRRLLCVVQEVWALFGRQWEATSVL